MLGKLMKYELKATSRTFLLLYIAVIFLAIVNRIFFAFDTFSGTGFNNVNTLYNVMVGAFITLYALMIVALFVAVTIVVIQRFYKNLYSDEGYLMFTLPVKSWEHIISKMLTASIWMVASTVVTVISIFVLISVPEVLSGMRHGIAELNEIIRQLEFSITPFIFEFIIVMILSVIGYALPFYACISIGQLWKKHRVLGAFIAYFVMNFITQIVSSILVSIISIPMIMRIDGMESSDAVTATILQYIHSVMIISIVLSVVLYVVYFFIAKHVMDKKLDLE